MKRFISILQFMTRIPIKVNTGIDEEFHKTIKYFPLVGLVLGIIIYLVGLLSSFIFDSFTTSIIIVLSLVILTGGLHIDGVGDTFDAIYSYRNKERMLEIMKDSRLGTNSLLAILFLIIFKISFIFNIIENELMWTIMFMPILGRQGVLTLMYKTVTPRENGMGNLFIGKATICDLIISISTTVVSILGIGILIFKESILIIPILSTIVIIYMFNILFKKHIYGKIDGITGDILGCSIELNELIYIVSIYALLC